MPFIQVPDVAAEVDKAIAAADPKAAPGSATIVAWIEKPGPSGMAAIKQQLKLPIIDEVPGAITIEAPNKARVTIEVADERGAIVLTPVPAKTKPPGACVAVAVARHEVYVHAGGVNEDGEYHDSTMHWVFEANHMLDVDGDGLLDWFVPVAPNKNACPEEVSWHVYVRRGTCGHDLGVVGPGSLDYNAAQVPLDASGFRPVALSAEHASAGSRGIPNMVTTVRPFAVVKGRYVQGKSTQSGGLCHHCATWYCTAP